MQPVHIRIIDRRLGSVYNVAKHRIKIDLLRMERDGPHTRETRT
jgi:hypothetical protein